MLEISQMLFYPAVYLSDSLGRDIFNCIVICSVALAFIFLNDYLEEQEKQEKEEKEKQEKEEKEKQEKEEKERKNKNS